MLRSYIIVALRNLIRDGAYAFVNWGSLTVGILCCLLVAAFVRFELSHDRSHDYAERTYRVVTTTRMSDSDVPTEAPAPLGPALVEDIPGVESQVRVHCSDELLLIDRGGDRFTEDGLCFADPTLFDVFAHTLQWGDVETALSEPFSLLISQQVATKYFGNTNPIGRDLEINGEHVYEVTGVLSAPEAPSHLQLSLVASFTTLTSLDPTIENWSDGGANPYVVLAPDYHPEQLEAYLSENLQSYMGYFGGDIRAHLQHLPDIYFSGWPPTFSERRGNRRYIYFFSTIALLVLVVACLNYMNLATARGLRRTREVGVRKAIGATRLQLVRQFLAESVLLTFAAYVAAILLTWIVLPRFGLLVHRHLQPSQLLTVSLLFSSTAATLAIGIVAGSYPAFYLSRADPATVLKGNSGPAQGSMWLRRVLVATQLAVAVGLAASTLVIWNQLNFLRHSQLGFNKDDVVILDPPEEIRLQYSAFKSELNQRHGVAGVTTAPMPGQTHVPITSHRIEGYDHEAQGIPWVHTFDVDDDFIKLLDIQLLAGRDFDPSRRTDRDGALLVNASAVRYFGWGQPEDAIGKSVRRPTGRGSDFKWRSTRVIGVVEDFQTWSMREQLKPVFIYSAGSQIGAFGKILVKIQSAVHSDVLADLESVWSRFAPHRPFVFSYLDEEVDQFYRDDIRQGRLLGTFSIVSILLASMGLFGLASFMVKQRRKEIGIRKILGASVSSVVGLLCREYMILTAAAFIVAIPATFVFMHQWLSEFAYSSGIGWGLVLSLGAATLSGTLVTVSYQSIKAALANPVNALKHE